MANPASFGDRVREARLAQHLGLREFAKVLGIAPSYLSDIENDRRVPAEEVTRDIAKALRLDFDDLMAAAGRFGADAERYLKKNPMAGALFRKISEGKFEEGELRKLLEQAERLRKPPK
jgi:transcriptional regulator with XRE-family HTH domain